MDGIYIYEDYDDYKLELIQVKKSEKEILKNLLEKYDYEFSQYDKRDVNILGLYGYDYLDNYWTEDKRWAFFIKVNKNLAGFIMINNYPEVEGDIDYTMAEFFVMYKYRRLGIGKAAAIKIFDAFPGAWQLKRHPKNIASVKFWNNVVNEYTNGQYNIVESHPDAVYDDGTCGDIIFFNNLNEDNKKSNLN